MKKKAQKSQLPCPRSHCLYFTKLRLEALSPNLMLFLLYNDTISGTRNSRRKETLVCLSGLGIEGVGYDDNSVATITFAPLTHRKITLERQISCWYYKTSFDLINP